MAQFRRMAYGASHDAVTCDGSGRVSLMSPDRPRSTIPLWRLSCLLGIFGILVACDEGGVDCGTTPLAPACSDPPTISYSQPTYVSAFFSTGSTPAPTVAWNGATGTLSLMGTVTGVTLDASTGVVSWDESLPIGVNAVQVVATNPAGDGTASFDIDNRFEGHFEGAYNNDPNSETVSSAFEMTFHGDGSMTVLDQGTFEGMGTWTRSGTTITAVYEYEAGNPLTVEGDVTHDASEAVLEGFWYNGDEAVAGEEQGFVSVAWASAVP